MSPTLMLQPFRRRRSERILCWPSTIRKLSELLPSLTRTRKAKGSESSGFFDLQSKSIPTGFPLKRESRKALMSTGSQTNLL
jgi:hypothetical protein